MRVVLGAGCLYKAEYLQEWFATLLREPGRRTQMSMIVYGPPGTGKSVVMNELMKKILGRVGWWMSGASTLSSASNFNAELAGKIYLCCEEVKESDGEFRAIMNGIKEAITGSTMVRKQKFESNEDVDNGLNIAFISNHRNPLPMVEGMSRRTCHLQVPSVQVIMQGGWDGRKCDCSRCTEDHTLTWIPPYQTLEEKHNYWKDKAEKLGLRDGVGTPTTHWVNSIFTYLVRAFKPTLGRINFNSEVEIPHSGERATAIFEGMTSTLQWLHVVAVKDPSGELPLTDWVETDLLHMAYKDWHDGEHGGSKKAMQSSKTFGEILNEHGCVRKYKGPAGKQKWCRRLSALNGLNPEILTWLKHSEGDAEPHEADETGTVAFDILPLS